MMPSMDGWSVLTALKADPQTHDIPVVMVSIVDDKKLGYALGVADYLTKPVDRTRLAAVMKRLVAQDRRRLALIVDDLETNRAILRSVLESEGWQSIEADDGRAGIEAFAREQPSLILLDLMMPGMDGFEFVRELRKREDGKEVPVIVVTAKDLTPAEREQLRVGVENIVQKSAVGPESLLGEIREKIAHVRPHA
jgi:CheY-like chemotaxis protein